MSAGKLSLDWFSVLGFEWEYMLVDGSSREIRSRVDELFMRMAACKTPVCEVERGMLGWSNELAAHVAEMKTPRPVRDFKKLSIEVRREIQFAQEHAEVSGLSLMPGPVHPFMNPLKELKLWPHGENDGIYEAYDRIFGCKGHGWANLQSVHLNFPFRGDDQFARLHTAIRVLLPLIPALTAGSPVLDGCFTGLMDARLDVYARNQQRVPEIAGLIVPEFVAGVQEYRDRILAPMYRAIAPHDPEGLLQEEWLNSHGAIARFDRNAIEIRICDIQETPELDISIGALIFETLRWLCEESPSSFAAQSRLDTRALAAVFRDTVREADRARVDDASLLGALGLSDPIPAIDLWLYIFNHLKKADRLSLVPDVEALRELIERGPLARRILKVLKAGNEVVAGHKFERPGLVRLCEALCACLVDGRPLSSRE